MLFQYFYETKQVTREDFRLVCIFEGMYQMYLQDLQKTYFWEQFPQNSKFWSIILGQVVSWP